MYDVIVCGGGTSGTACAYTSAKSGLKTLLIERNIHLGGSITSGLVIPAMKTVETGLNQDFFNDFINYAKKYNAQSTYIDGNKGWFNPELAKIVFDEMLNDVGCDILFSTQILGVNTSADISNCNNRVSSIKVSPEMLSICFDCDQFNVNVDENSGEILSICIDANYFIDSTGDGILCKLAGAKPLDNEGAHQATTLRFIMSGVDVKDFGDWICELDADRNVTTAGIIDGQYHLSTAYTWDRGKNGIPGENWALRPIFEKAISDKTLEEQDSAYFQIFTVPGMPNSIAFNCPRISANPINDGLFDASYLLIEGRRAIWRISNFVKKYLKGFENSYISNIADMLGVREYKRWEGKYIYKFDDMKSGKSFDNAVLTSDYPVDVHSEAKDESLLEHLNVSYSLPIESLMVKNFENLFVVGRCLSADFKAQAALRVQTSCFSMGEAVAKYIRSKT